ncbi:MAG: hypothetical protein V2I39_12915 [Erythrobacter sp.]|jgi:hypothetical protein|nr:hypothetical protein [Erythrobacter sp.]
MSRPEPIAALKKALSALDFAEDNAERDRLKAELAHCATRSEEVRVEADRLAADIQGFRGPEPDAIAAAILGGAKLAEATRASESLDDLRAQRTALMAAMESLRAHADDLRTQLADVEHGARLKVAKACEPYVEALAARQRQAAETIVEVDAALQAIGGSTRCFVEGDRASKLARNGVLGNDSILGWPAELTVPPELVNALEGAAERCDALGPIPATFATKYLT